MNETKTKTCFDKQEREKIDDKNDDMQNLKEWHCNADVIDKKINKVYEFVEVSFFLVVSSSNSNEPVYFLETEEMGLNDNELRDWFAHVVFRRKCYFEENYLKSPLKINIYDSIYPSNNQCPSHIETTQLSAL